MEIKPYCQKVKEMCKSIFITRFIRPIYENYFNLKPLFSDKIIKQPNQIVYVKVNNLNWSIYPSPKFNIEWLKSNQSIELPKSQKVRPKKKLLMTYVRKRGMIRGGDWDQKKYNFKKEVPYIAFKQRFLQNKRLSNTIYHDYYKKLKERNEGYQDYTFIDFKQNRLENYDKLFKEIKEFGYLKQRELKSFYYSNNKEVEIGISRKGERLFINGRHRLSIAKILDLDEIPVIVNVWHKQYIDWVKENTDIDKITPKTAIQPILDGRAEEIAH